VRHDGACMPGGRLHLRLGPRGRAAHTAQQYDCKRSLQARLETFHP
jgi:hypothetical protein